MKVSERLEIAKKTLRQCASVKEAQEALGMTNDSMTNLFARAGLHAKDYLRGGKAVESARAADEMIARLVALSKKKSGTTIEQACDALDLSPRRLRDLVTEAQEKGCLVDFVGATIGIRQHAPSLETVRAPVQPAGPKRTFGVASDIHVGSKWFLRDQFIDHIHRCYDRGARLIFLPGDLVDGCYRHSRWEETHHGFNDQARYFFDVLPKLPGLFYRGIGGNHDETFEEGSGLSFVQSMNDMALGLGRRDFELTGMRGAYFRLAAKGERRGIFVELWHPRSGNSYALTYHLQKHVEKYAVGSKPDVCLAGHWHTNVYCTIRGVHSLACGTFHGGGGNFSKALGGVQSIGSWIVDYAVTKDGALREFQPEWRAYYERETVRDVALG